MYPHSEKIVYRSSWRDDFSVRSRRASFSTATAHTTRYFQPPEWQGDLATLSPNLANSTQSPPQRSCRDRHAFRRAFVLVFRAAGGFLRFAPVGFLVLDATVFLALDTADFLTFATVGFLAFPTAGFRAFAKVGFFALTATSTGTGDSSSGDFRVRWCPRCSDWMRAASFSVRNVVSSRLRRSSARYSGIVFVVMAAVCQNCPRPSCPIVTTRA